MNRESKRQTCLLRVKDMHVANAAEQRNSAVVLTCVRVGIWAYGYVQV